MPANVVIVDDEPHIATSLRFLMQQQGYNVTVITDGQEALTYIETHLPDLVLLDVMLPSMNGYEICERMCNNPLTTHIKVIMLTARGSSKDIETGMALGVDLYVTKPFSTRDLVARVKTFLTPS